MNPSISEALFTTLGNNFLDISKATELGMLSEAMICRLMEEKKLYDYMMNLEFRNMLLTGFICWKK